MPYFDHAATSFPKPPCVYDFANRFYQEYGANAGRGQYQMAAAANQIVEDTRRAIKKLFSAPANYQVIFTPSATIALNTILRGLPCHAGQNIYVTHFEHNAVLRTLFAMQKEVPFRILKIATQQTLSYDLEEITEQFRQSPPNIVVCSHASNVCGLIAPVTEIFKLAKQYGAITILDASQTAGTLEIDLTKILADFLVFAGHKSLYAPFGAAGFLTSDEYELPPFIYGGTGFRSGDLQMPNELPQKYEAGSLNIYAIAGLNQSLKWLRTTGISAIREKENRLTKKLKCCLMEMENFTIFCPKNSVGILSFTVPGYTPDEIGKILDRYEISVRTGLHCAPDAHRFLGTYPSGTVRISIGYFNTEDEVDKLVEVLKMISG